MTWSWERSQNGTSSWTLISGETSATYTPVAADETRFLRATASYTDGEGSGKSAQAVSTNRVLPAPVAPNDAAGLRRELARDAQRGREHAPREHRRARRGHRPRERYPDLLPGRRRRGVPSTSTPASCRPRPIWTSKRPLHRNRNRHRHGRRHRHHRHHHRQQRR